jgi:hypothetical protein
MAQLSYGSGQNYPAGTPIVWNFNQQQTGSAITQNNGTFTLSQNGTYLINYNLTTAGGSAPALRVVPSGGVTSTTTVSEITGPTNPGEWTGTALITVNNAPGYFSVQPSGGDITLHPNSPQGTITVVKVS